MKRLLRNIIRYFAKLAQVATPDDITQLLTEQNLDNLIIDSMNNPEASNARGTTDKAYCDHQIIVSLTSYGERVSLVYRTIESIMRQSMKANRIVLWLDKQWEDRQLPLTLQNQIGRGLEVYYTQASLRSYKKIIPSLEMFPDATIITVDDDIFYGINVLENLITTHLDHPHEVCFTRAHRITIKNGRINPYNKWEYDTQSKQQNILDFPTGCAGVLYPSGVFNEQVLNKAVFLEDSPFADDVWLYAMALLNGTKNRRAYNSISNSNIFMSSRGQDQALTVVNVQKNQNDVQLHKVFTRYNLYEKLGCRALK